MVVGRHTHGSAAHTHHQHQRVVTDDTLMDKQQLWARHTLPACNSLCVLAVVLLARLAEAPACSHHSVAVRLAMQQLIHHEEFQAVLLIHHIWAQMAARLVQGQNMTALVALALQRQALARAHTLEQALLLALASQACQVIHHLERMTSQGCVAQHRQQPRGMAAQARAAQEATPALSVHGRAQLQQPAPNT